MSQHVPACSKNTANKVVELFPQQTITPALFEAKVKMLFHQGVYCVVLGWIYCFRFALGASLNVDDFSHHGSSTGSERNLTNASNETCHAPGFDGTSQVNNQCAVWLARSTIPGAGLGMFAGKEFRRRNDIMQGGDLAIPIVDPLVDLPAEYPFYLLNDYTWAGDELYMGDIGTVEVNVISPGLGGAINSMPDFNNADETYPLYSVPHGLHRRSDPGAGAFTYYHSRKTRALSKINPGDELFASYGDAWFIQRKSALGPVPLEGDHAHADSLYRKLKSIFNKDQPDPSKRNEQRVVMLRSDLSGVKVVEQNMVIRPPAIDPGVQQQQGEAAPKPTPRNPKKIADELWEDFVIGSPWDDSPTMAALPSTKEDYAALDTQSLKKLKKPRLNRSLEWLQENGVCADTMHVGLSTIRQAGHGAFASWKLRQGTVVLPIPLIHTPYRVVLNLYDGKPPYTSGKPRGSGKKVRFMPPQLLLNYCMGHRDSTVLLTPYGPLFSFINHNKTLANVKLQWASPQRSQHNPALLNMTIIELGEILYPQLAMELVALRDIEPGEEIFLDYGDEWEAAWQKHVDEWKPVKGADTYVSAFEMNQQFDHVFRTDSEQEENPYPSNLMIKFHYYFVDDAERRLWLKKNPIPFAKAMDDWKKENSGECMILRRHQYGRRTLYGILVRSQELPNEWVTLKYVPQEALFFQDRPYTTDMFLKNAFRHDLRIPDELFPEKWKNGKENRNKFVTTE